MLIQRELNDGASIGRIAMDHFPEYIRFHKAFGEYRNLRCERRNWEMDVQIYVGYTGCGKPAELMTCMGIASTSSATADGLAAMMGRRLC